MERLTIIAEDEEGVSERIRSFLIEITEILLGIEKRGYRSAAWQPVDSLTDSFFDWINSRCYIKVLPDYEDVRIRNTKDLMKDNGCRWLLVRGYIAKKDGRSTLYMKGVTDIL